MLKINPVSLRTSLSYLKSQRDLVFKSKHREPSKWKKFVEDIWSYFIRSRIFKIRGTWYHLDSHCECLVYTTSMFNTSN